MNREKYECIAIRESLRCAHQAQSWSDYLASFDRWLGWWLEARP